jgi:RimJ/RimL family protein N-acetyltransferase
MKFPFDRHIVIENQRCIIQPTEEDHFSELLKIAREKDIWKYMTYSYNSDKSFQDYVSAMIQNRQRQVLYPFSIFDKKYRCFAGMSAYGNISNIDSRLEIGWTWYGAELQGTDLHNNVMYELIKYAFETLFAERIEFKTDVFNLRSRNALKKIGATEEGILRSHMLKWDGKRRDTIFFSILKEEWESVMKNNFSSYK